MMEAAVKEALGTTVLKSYGFGGGGCISSGSSYKTDQGIVYVKRNSNSNAYEMFVGEKAGLEAIQMTEAIKVPKALAIVNLSKECGLVMNHVDMRPLSSAEQAVLGEQFARMHMHNSTLIEREQKNVQRVRRESDPSSPKSSDLSLPVTQFGFHVPTCCGSIAQVNEWQDDWATFYIRQRLQHQVDLILTKSGDRQLNEKWPLCLRNLEVVLGRLKNVVPSLLHGDLWTGNVGLCKETGVPFIFDPAVYYGHSECDLGNAKMFGGFTSEFYTSYHRLIPKTEGVVQRIKIYELFHHLNHWNHFGGSYKGSSLSLITAISEMSS